MLQRSGLAFVLLTSASTACMPPPAETPPRPTRWEYMCIDGWAGVTHSANQLGKDGWEMAAAAGTADHMMWCFKRRMP